VPNLSVDKLYLPAHNFTQEELAFDLPNAIGNVFVERFLGFDAF